MALYRLVSDAEQIRDLIADRAGRDLQGVDVGGPLHVVLRAWAEHAYRQLGRYPGLAAYVIVRWTELPAWLDVVESFLARADDEGLAGERAVATVNAVFAYVLVRAQLHDAAGGAPSRDLAPLRNDPYRYPHVGASQAEFRIRRTDNHFRFGLDALLAGLAAASAPARP